jgi:hypothetical protein
MVVIESTLEPRLVVTSQRTRSGERWCFWGPHRFTARSVQPGWLCSQGAVLSDGIKSLVVLLSQPFRISLLSDLPTAVDGRQLSPAAWLTTTAKRVGHLLVLVQAGPRIPCRPLPSMPAASCATLNLKARVPMDINTRTSPCWFDTIRGNLQNSSSSFRHKSHHHEE